ncbi:MAG TPA: ABC transporter substrate-binding protein [Actinomycetota bacterium]|nr:ABC transporter substrate-binding protein [Actinomycetota bacterium]
MLAAWLAVAAGCGAERSSAPTASTGGFPVRVNAANGEVRIPARPERIVSLSPTATETLFAIGAGPQVVAVDSRSSHPPDAPRTELSGLNPNIEAVAAYKPDLVVYASDPVELGESLDSLGVPRLLQPPAGDLADAYSQIRELGVATGHSLQAADLVERVEQSIERSVRSLPHFTRPLTYYHEVDQSYFTATSRTFIGQIYGLLGLRNIADGADRLGNGYPQLSAEFIIEANPDLIFLADARCCGQSAETLRQRPAWGQIAAVANGAVIPLDDDLASRWGPRVGDLVESVAGALRAAAPNLQ